MRDDKKNRETIVGAFNYLEDHNICFLKIICNGKPVIQH